MDEKSKRKINKLNISYKPVGIIDDVPVVAGVVVVVVVVGLTNGPGTTAKYNMSQPSCTYTCT